MPKRCRGRRRTGRCTSPTTATTASARSTRADDQHRRRQRRDERQALGDGGPATQATSATRTASRWRRRHAVHLPGRGQYSDSSRAPRRTRRNDDTYAGGGNAPPTASWRPAISFTASTAASRTSHWPPTAACYIVRRQRAAQGHARRATSQGRRQRQVNYENARRRGPSCPRSTRRSIRGPSPWPPTGQRANRRLPATCGYGGWTATARSASSPAMGPRARQGVRDGGPALEARFDIPQGLTTGPDGAIYLSDWDTTPSARSATRCPASPARTSRSHPRTAASCIASTRPADTYRHATPPTDRSRRPSATPATAVCGDRGRHANTIRIERDPDGEPAAIIAPFGQRTSLDVDTDGYLARSAIPPAARRRWTTPAAGC